MPIKKKLGPRKIPVNPDTYRRGCEFLADHLLRDAEAMNRSADAINELRLGLGVPENESMNVHYIAAAMAVFLAHEIVSGRLSPSPSKAPQESK